jgi:hypothetical protein
MNEELVGVFAALQIADSGVLLVLYNKDYDCTNEKNTEALLKRFQSFVDKPVRVTVSLFDGDAKRMLEVD